MILFPILFLSIAALCIAVPVFFVRMILEDIDQKMRKK